MIFILSVSIYQRNIGSKRTSLASVVTPGSPTKKPYSASGSNLSKAFKGAAHAGKRTGVDRNAAMEKEGKIFVQVLYPDNVITAGASFTTLYIKVVQYKGGGLSLCGFATTTSSLLHSNRF